MGDSRNGDGVALASTIIVVLVLLTTGAAALMWLMWQRQAALVQAERSIAEAVRAQALIERQIAEPGPPVPEPPDHVGRDPESIEASIRNILQAQQRAWNAGDIDQFMESYWNSADLTFSSGGTLTRTWQGTLENYRQRYPTRGDMGTLSFRNLEVTPLGTDAALVLGEWQLRRESEELGGNFTLVFRYLGGRWVIVHDHTSRTEEP